jgi:Tfp pilus assembly protein PilO
MSDLRNPEYRLPLVMSSLAAVIVASALVYMIFVPKPSTVNLERKTQNQLYAVKKEEKANRLTIAEGKARVDKLTWAGGAQQVAAGALSKVTEVAKNHKLKLVAFRPQRDQDANGLGQLPILISLDGAYPDVVAFTRDLETEESKLAINLVQVAAADAATDRVTASVGIVAYLNPDNTTVTKKEDPTNQTVKKETKRGTRK